MKFMDGLFLATFCAYLFFGLPPFPQYDWLARLLEILGVLVGLYVAAREVF